MALNRKGNTEAPRGGFEDTDAPAAQAVTADVKPTVQEQAKADVGATAAVATAAASSSRAVTVGAPKFTNFFKQFENALPQVGYNTLPRLVGAQGSVSIKGNGVPDVDLGDKIKVAMYSYNETYVLSPGSDAEAAKKLVRYSRDGVTIDDTGEPVDAYLAQLREDDWPNAKKKKYLNIIGEVTETSKNGDKVVGDMVQIQVSPDGVESFNGFQMQKSLKIARDPSLAETANVISVTAVKKSGNGKNWTTLVVGDK